MNDPPIHLLNYSFCKKESHREPSVTVPIWLTQSSLDGMASLISHFEGVEAAGRGRISGSFELTMFYRTIRHDLDEYQRKKLNEKV